MIINAYTEQQNAQSRETAYFVYMLGDLCGASVARLFDSKNKYPKIYEVFPDHFDEPDEDDYWKVFKTQLLNFAGHHNDQRHAQEEYKKLMAQRAKEDAEMAKRKQEEGKA